MYMYTESAYLQVKCSVYTFSFVAAGAEAYLLLARIRSPYQ